VIEEFPHWGFIFENVKMVLHRPEGGHVPEGYDFAQLIEGYDEADPWMEYPHMFVQHELFTLAEVAAIEAYFAKCAGQGITVYKTRQAFPIASDAVPCNIDSYGHCDGEYRFDAEDGFDCPVPVWGYCWLGDAQPVAMLMQAVCRANGSVALEALRHAYWLPAAEDIALFDAWTKAKSTGHEQALTLRAVLEPRRDTSSPNAATSGQHN
jgi:hypothetical protein